MGWIKDLPNSVHNPDSPTYTGGATSSGGLTGNLNTGDDGGLSLGGSGDVQMPGSVYNPITGKYETYGGNVGGSTYDEKPGYKQHVFLGTEHGTVWLPENVDPNDYLANPGAYTHVDNADGFSRTVTGGDGTGTGNTGGGMEQVHEEEDD